MWLPDSTGSMRSHVGESIVPSPSFDALAFVAERLEVLGAGVVSMTYRTFSEVRGRGDVVSEERLGDALSAEVPKGYAGDVLREIWKQLGENRLRRYPSSGGDIVRLD